MSSSPVDITIAGAGLAGLFTAYALAKHGVRVEIVDPHPPGSGASQAAAGMLAPCYEAVLEGREAGDPFLKTCLMAREEWATAHEPLEAESGLRIGYSDTPSLVRPAVGQGRASLNSTARHLDRLNLPFAWQGDALELPLDGQVDNRAVITALVAVLEGRGVMMRDASLADARGDILVDARGWRGFGVSPVKGTAISFAPHPGLPEQVIRFGARYLAPKRDRVVLGATSLAGASDTSVGKDDVDTLIKDAAALYPAVLETDILERWSGVRPRTADGMPVLGWTGPRHFAVGGFFRNGVLLAPLMGTWAAQLILGESIPPGSEVFDPVRLSLSAA